MVDNQISIPNPVDPIPASTEYIYYQNAYLNGYVFTIESNVYENAWTQKGESSIFSFRFKDGVIYNSNAPITVTFYYKSNYYVNFWLHDKNCQHINQSIQILQSTNDLWQFLIVDVTQYLINYNADFLLLDDLEFSIMFDNDGDPARYGRIKDINVQYQTVFSGQMGGEDFTKLNPLVGRICSENKSYQIIIASNEPWHFEKLERPWQPDTYNLSDNGISMYPDSGDIGLTNVTITLPPILSDLMHYQGNYLINLEKESSSEIFKINISFISPTWFEINGIACCNPSTYSVNKDGEEVLLKMNNCIGNGWKIRDVTCYQMGQSNQYFFFNDSYPYDFHQTDYNNFLYEQSNWLTISPIENTSTIDQTIAVTVQPNTSPATRVLTLQAFTYNNTSILEFLSVEIFQESLNPLYQPIDFVASPQSSQVDLSWQDDSRNTNTLGFRIKKFISNQWIQIADVGVNTLSYSDLNLESLTTYEYSVCAYNQIGDSWNTTVTVTTLAPPYNFLNNLIGYYDLEEISGGVLTKVGSYNGTVYGSPLRNQSGKHNKCYKLTGNNAINLGDNSYRLTNNFTISLWVNLMAITNAAFFSRYFSSTGYRCFYFGINSSGAIYINVYRPDNTVHSTVSSPGIISISNWHHIILKKDGNTIKIQLDGIIIASKNDAPTTLRDQTGNGSNLKTYIGAVAKSSTIPDAFLNGYIDEVAIWEVGLSDEYIQQLWNNGAGYFYDNF